MKKIIFILFLCVFFVTPLLGQTKSANGLKVLSSISRNEIVTFYFDLHYYHDSLNTKDSVEIFVLGDEGKPELLKFYLDGNSNSTSDSLYVRTGVRKFNASGIVTDTIWGQIHEPLRDSSWVTPVNLMINSATGNSYFLVVPVFDIIQIGYLNPKFTDVDRTTTIGVSYKR